jgi:hypothetical protein
MKYALALLCCALSMPATAGVNLGNVPSGGAIGGFGTPDSKTYGQVFTAPVTGKLTSFKLWLNGGVGALFGAVGTWNGTSAYAFGNGSPTTLYTSGLTQSTGAQGYQFTPNVNVTAGQLYVAYLTVFGAPASGNTTMPLGTNAAGLNYFVWNNTSNPNGNPSWNYFFNTGNAQFAASFDAAVSPTPEPEAWASMALGLGLAGWVARRRKAKLAAAAA